MTVREKVRPVLRRRQPLERQVVVVTGAARGLGAALALQLTGQGALVALLDRTSTGLDAVSASCPGSAWWTVDVTDGRELSRVAAEVAAHFGRIDSVVSNAGIGDGGTLLHADEDDYDRVIEVNLLGSVRTARAFLPHLVATRGHFLQIASLAAFTPVPGMGSYCASKSGVEAFAHSLRPEVAHHGVTVGVAYLSWTDTDMVREADLVPGFAEFRAGMPGVFGHTYPLEPVAAALARGIAKRKPHVYGQRWLALVPAVRGLLPVVAAHRASKDVARLEKVYAASRQSARSEIPVPAATAEPRIT